MKRTKLTLAFAVFLLSASFLHAELIRTEISQKAGRAVNSVADDSGGAIGASVERNFDLKGSNAAYETMIDRFLNAESETEERTPSPCTGKSSHFNKLTEHDYARPGAWAVHYFTDKRGKFACVSMIRFYDNGTMLRVSRDDTHLHVDARGDWNLLKGASKDRSGNIVVTLASDDSPDDDSLKYEGTVIEEGGDKWLRISQSFEEPGGLADIYRNSESLRLKFTQTKYWSFNLKGSHAADVKMDECIAKYRELRGARQNAR